jgi:hypothetical protein
MTTLTNKNTFGLFENQTCVGSIVQPDFCQYDPLKQVYTFGDVKDNNRGNRLIYVFYGNT